MKWRNACNGVMPGETPLRRQIFVTYQGEKLRFDGSEIGSHFS